MGYKYTTAITPGPENDFRIAIHEAGHALFRIEKGYRFSRVKVGPDEYGCVFSDGSPDENPDVDYSDEDLQFWQDYYAAGAAAEFLEFGEIRAGADKTDRVLYANLPRPQDYNASTERALQVLRGCRQSIQQLARTLDARERDEYKTLNYKRVFEAIGRPSPY